MPESEEKIRVRRESGRFTDATTRIFLGILQSDRIQPTRPLKDTKMTQRYLDLIRNEALRQAREICKAKLDE